MSILAVGSIAYDSIATPKNRVKEILGGSAVYFSLTARFFGQTNIVAVVGKDFKKSDRDLLEKREINLTGVETKSGKTFRWSGKYGSNPNSRQTLFTHLNAFEKFNPKILPQHLKTKYLFLGNIDPDVQRNVLKQIKKPKLVVCDTMNYWILKKRKSLLQNLKLIDILIINDEEARLLSGKFNLVAAAKNIVGQMEATRRGGAATLIIKRGEYGLLMFERKKMFSIPAYPLEKVVDPTGAGDTFAGGFVGYLSSVNKLDGASFRRATVIGTIMASFAVERLGTNRIINLKKSEITKRLKEFKHLVKI